MYILLYIPIEIFSVKKPKKITLATKHWCFRIHSNKANSKCRIIILILLCMAEPFIAPGCFCLIIAFTNTIAVYVHSYMNKFTYVPF